MKRIGRYEVVRELRGGGMGTVTLGKSPDGQLVVLKRPHSVDPEAAVRLRDEARIGARLLHPSVVDTLDLFELDSGVPVLVVAYVDGPSLEVLRPLGPLPIGVIARVGRQIAEGLAALHESTDEHGQPLHILHRDVTPGNIVVGRDGDAKLIDLGIARFSERQAERTQDGFLRGTMRYLAPELLQGDTYSAASDLWALGMVLWEAALGRFAYRGETDREVLAGILRGEPMELDEGEHVDEEVIELIRALLQPSPLTRIRSGAAAAARFAAICERHEDTAALTRDVIERALVRKSERDAEQKAKLASMLRPENLGFPVIGRGHAVASAELFADEATAAEVERYDDGGREELAEMPHTEPLGDDEDPRSRWRHRGGPPAIKDDHEEYPTAPLKGAGALPSRRPLADDDEKTVNVPAPISFLTPPQERELAGAGHGTDDEPDEDALDPTTPMPTLRLPAAALRSVDGVNAPAAAEATLSFDGEDTASVSDPRVPKEAFRSDAPDLPARARELDSGEIATPDVIATRGPAPEIDDDELEDMHTLDGLSPLRAPTPAKAPAEVLIPAPAAAATPAVLTSSSEPRPLARIALVRKTAAQLASERARKHAPSASIDDLPPARPKPRQELADDDVTTVSPFSPPGADSAEHEAQRARKKRGRGARRKAAKEKRAPGGERAPPPPEVVTLADDHATESASAGEDEPDPSSIETRFVDEAMLKQQIAERTEVSPPEGALPSSALGARMVELPTPQPPVVPAFRPAEGAAASHPYAAAPSPDAHPAATPLEQLPAAARDTREPPRERAAGEVMKLNDMVAFLDDD